MMMMMKANALPLLPLLLAAAAAATAGAGAATPVAWVAESEEYASLLRAKLTTPWDVRWCGANGSACVAGSDPSSAAVKAIVGRPVAGELSALPNLALVQGASWFQEYPQADVPLRSAIAYADEYPSPVRASAELSLSLSLSLCLSLTRLTSAPPPSQPGGHCASSGHARVL